MTRLVALITRFYEVFPGHWLVIGSTNLPVLQDVSIILSDSLNISGSFCQLSSLSIKFSKGPDQGDVKSNDFVAFLSINRKASVSGLLINGQSVICSPKSLNCDSIHWPSQLQDVLKALRVHDRSKLEIERLLHGALLDFVQKGEQYWSTQQPWMNESFEFTKMGCQFASSEITLLHVSQSSDHHLLLNWLRRLCSSSWCMSGHVRIIIVVELSCCPDVFINQLQKLLELEQIALEIIVPSREMSLGDCVNLGTYVANSECILLDLSLAIECLTGLMTCISGPSSLEPLKLIYPGLRADLMLRMIPPMLFSRQSFLGLGGVLNLGNSVVSVSKQMIQLFSSDRHHGVRECLDQQSKGFASSMYLSIQEDDSSKSAWDLAFERYLLVG